MGRPSVVIAVEGHKVSDVEACLGCCLGVASGASSSFRGTLLAGFADLALTVEDVRETNAYAQAFLKERGLEDCSAAWRQYPSEKFPVNVTIEAPYGSIGECLLEILGDSTSRELSRQLVTRTILSIDNGYVPFAAYERGKRIETFDEECREHFSSRGWVPDFMR